VVRHLPAPEKDLGVIVLLSSVDREYEFAYMLRERWAETLDSDVQLGIGLPEWMREAGVPAVIEIIGFRFKVTDDDNELWITYRTIVDE
jgi:hypothetical protein